MPERTKYALRIAISPQNAVEGVTYMDLNAVLAEIKRANTDYDFAIFDCISEDESIIKVVIKAADIQLIMHNAWKKPVQSQIAVPKLVQ